LPTRAQQVSRIVAGLGVGRAAYRRIDVVDIRHLDQIREHERGGSGRGIGPWLLGAVGVGAVVLTAVMSMPTKQLPAQSTVDPLSELLAKTKEETRAKEEKSLPADELSHDHTSFAELLTDRERPSTALVAVKGRDGRWIDAPEEVELPAGPPPGDELPVVPLPAGRLLESSRMSDAPRDGLTELAADRAQLPPGSEKARAGSPGEYAIQVASFRDLADANTYVEELRLRGHAAYRESARVTGRGLWQRVRIGPFRDKFKALAYKVEFEHKEGMAALLVDPAKLESREAQRAIKLAERVESSR
jgi:DedD protein